ncbi:MAG: hypothetical protein GX577_13175 [Leptolinea sp.]|nr:hypothetical protein [Leptolinea sp.]
MNLAFQLSRLQKMDSELDQITIRKNEIVRLIQDETIVNEVKERLNEKQSELDNNQKVLKKIEEKNNQLQLKLQEDEHALYGGKIKLPRELQDLQNEISSLKKQTASQDEDQLNTMMTIEDLENEKSLIQRDLVAAESVFATKVAGLKGELSSLEKKKENLLAERDAAIQNVDAASLERYETLRKAKRGLAVAVVVDQACTACGATLTPADWQAARSPQRLVTCSSCGRILYAG